MPRKHYANAIISRQNVPFDEWMDVLRGQNEGAVPKDHINRVAKTVLRKCDPNQYLLSHSTIVASVDTIEPKGTKTGRLMNRGVQIDVRYPDFRIKSGCLPIINNNGDAWSRSLLLSSYRTFIGSPNYLEHVQIPELSKGFIVDAVARDLGDSCYVDILVATDRKHGQLVNDILTGDITGMSMGCISLFTICTKCGNVASDDSQLCPCIQYEGKHTEFIDEQGNKQKIAELIGHVMVPNSNQFIEASWVKNPAFTGAVRRNFLNQNMIQTAAKINDAAEVYEIKRSMPDLDGMKRAAFTYRKSDDDETQDIGDGQEPSQSQNGPSSDSERPVKSDQLNSLIDKVQEQLLSLIMENLSDRLKPKPEDVGTVVSAPVDLTAGNDNIIHSSADFERHVKRKFASSTSLADWAIKTHKIVHEGGVKSIKAARLKPQDLIILSWVVDNVNGRRYASDLYQLSIKIGPLSNYPNEISFLTACSIKFGRDLTAKEERFLVWKGKIASIACF